MHAAQFAAEGDLQTDAKGFAVEASGLKIGDAARDSSTLIRGELVIAERRQKSPL